jgi:hypothetical protein
VVDDYALRQQKEENENPDVPAANAFNVHTTAGTTTENAGRIVNSKTAKFSTPDGNDKQQSWRHRHRYEKKFLPAREFSRFRHRDLLYLGLADESGQSILNDVILSLPCHEGVCFACKDYRLGNLHRISRLRIAEFMNSLQTQTSL